MSQADQQQRSRAPKIHKFVQSQADAPRREQEHLQTLRRFDAGAEALIRVRDQLGIRTPERQGCCSNCEHDEAEAAEVDPDGAKP